MENLYCITSYYNKCIHSLEYTEELVILSIKRRGKIYDKKSLLNDTKKFLKNRHGLSVLVIGYLSFFKSFCFKLSGVSGVYITIAQKYKRKKKVINKQSKPRTPYSPLGPRKTKKPISIYLYINITL